MTTEAGMLRQAEEHQRQPEILLELRERHGIDPAHTLISDF